MPKNRRKSASKKRDTTPPWFRKLLIAASIFFFVVIAGTAFFFVSFFSGVGNNVVIEVEGPEEILRGVPFEVEVSMINETGSLVGDAELTVSLSGGMVDLGSLEEGASFADQIGDLGEGSIAKRTYRFLAVGDDEEKASFNLSYFASHQNRFQTGTEKKFKIGGSAVRVEVVRPEQVLPGSVFEIDIRYENDSEFDLPEAVLEVKYPTSFRFVSSSLSPDSLDNYWRLGELRSGSSGNLQVRGTIESGENNSFTFPVIFSARFLGEDFPVVEEPVELSVSPSPVGLNLSVNRRVGYVARVGDRLTYTIRYENSSGIALTDVVMKAELTGELFDFSTLSSNGSVNVPARTVNWDVSNIPALRLVGAGQSGEVSFDVRLKNQFPITRLNDKDFSLRVRAELTSPSVPYYLSATETRAETSVDTKVAGLIEIDVRAYYRDALSKIVNTGSMPPKVGMPTEYTIHWILTNYGTDVTEVSVKTFLPQNVNWTGIVKSNTETVPLYDAETREVTWNIDKIRATKGVLDEPLAAVFQINATPAQSDLGNFKELITPTILRATDGFTGLVLTHSDVAINSSLPDDLTIGQNGGRVIPQ